MLAAVDIFADAWPGIFDDTRRAISHRICDLRQPQAWVNDRLPMLGPEAVTAWLYDWQMPLTPELLRLGPPRPLLLR